MFVPLIDSLVESIRSPRWMLSIMNSQEKLPNFVGTYCFRISQSIIDAILALSLDDIPSNLAAATLFFVLTADVSDLQVLLYMFLMFNLLIR